MTNAQNQVRQLLSIVIHARQSRAAMAIFKANFFANCTLNYVLANAFDYKFAGNHQTSGQSDRSHFLPMSTLVQASMLDEGFGIDARALIAATPSIAASVSPI